MKLRNITALLVATLCVTIISGCSGPHDEMPKGKYIVLASEAVMEDSEWAAVAQALAVKHGSEIVTFSVAPREALDALREAYPRYVAIVDMPENIGRDYVIDLHHLCREIDGDIYGDYLWGIITGYNAEAAMRMVENSTEPLVIKDAVATIMELNSAKWFDNYAWVDDHTKGLWGEKQGRDGEIITGMVAPEEVLGKFTALYEVYDPDLIVTAAHATQKNLEMPYSLGHIKPRDGRLYAQNIFTGEERFLNESGKRRVYAAVGNCLIGDVNNSRESMAVAWMNGSNVATMIGYVVTTWHGRSGWGALKYWVTNPHRYTLAESVFLNQQDFLHQQHAWYPELIDVLYPDFEDDEFEVAPAMMTEVLGREPSDDELGFWHDRDVLAYYGDPMWSVTLQSVEDECDYSVTSTIIEGRCIVTITTDEDFSLERMRGDKFKEEHVLDLPFSYFFPERLTNPRLAEGEMWDVAIDENFLLVYNANFEPGKSYEIVIDVD